MCIEKYSKKCGKILAIAGKAWYNILDNLFFREELQMGMTDKQFNCFLRFLLDAIRDAENETDEKKHKEKIEKILDNLQKTLED